MHGDIQCKEKNWSGIYNYNKEDLAQIPTLHGPSQLQSLQVQLVP